MNSIYAKVLEFLEKSIQKNPDIYQHFGSTYAYIPSAYFTMPVIADITQKLAEDFSNGNTLITDLAMRMYMFLGKENYQKLYDDIESLLTELKNDVVIAPDYQERLELFDTEETFGNISLVMITLFCLENTVSILNQSDK